MSTPELDKMQAVKTKSQAIGEFLEWLQREKGAQLSTPHAHNEHCYQMESPPSWVRDQRERRCLTCGLNNGDLLTFHYSTERLLAEYFEIDLKKVDDERRAILQSLQLA